MKQRFSIAPWSLLLSLYFIPTQSSFAQETDGDDLSEVDSGDQSESEAQSDSEEGSGGSESSVEIPFLSVQFCLL